jgi:LmbE family N-acetylglucosaminyl deacetylase
MKALFVSPHPDDVEIGCGGTVARYVREGHEVHLAVMTGPGDLKMVHSGKVVEWETRVAEQEKAFQALGGSKIWWCDAAPAAKFDTVPLAEGVGILEAILQHGCYDEMFLPMPSFAQDHRWVYQAGIAATRPTKFDKVKILLYEQPSQDHGDHNMDGSRYYVTYGSEEWDQKQKAILAHGSQMEGRRTTLVGWSGPYQLARLRGLEVGAEYAERFFLVRSVI